MMIFALLLLHPLFIIPVYAASVPVLYCMNEKAGAHDCIEESDQALDATRDWFDQYLTNHGGSFGRRHLLDCRRFCDSDPKHFSVHYPCHCRDSRKLNAIEVDNSSRNLKFDALDGPIQLFKDYSYRLPESKCKKVLNEAQCIVVFVEKYAIVDNDSQPGNETDSQSSGDSKAAAIDESYNPNTGNYELYDPETGDLVNPEHSDDDKGEQDEESGMYDPVTGKWVKIDPNTGLPVGENNASSEPEANNGILYEEVYDPVTGTYKKIDPNTGLPVDP
jgi:hypothetical protein